MGLRYENLDSEVRQAMVDEIALAIESGKLYRSKVLTDEGHETWPDLLRSAATSHDDDWLASQLQGVGMMLSHTATDRGKRKVNPGAASTLLAQREFNLYYSLAVCVVAMASEEDTVEIYRARDSENTRSSSAALVGRVLPAIELLTDIRRSGGIESALGLNKPGSGLSVRRM